MFGWLKKRIMYIDVRIPFDENNRLAMAYNRALADGISEWVLFLDHDVFLCNPLWYEMCLEVIESLRIDPKVACIGCVAGGSRHKRTMEQHGPPNSQIEDHIEEAKRRYKLYGNLIEEINIHVPGFFMLLNRRIAEVIKFRQINSSINNIDKDFGTRLMEAGYHIYHMKGLYVYHRRGMKHLKKEFRNG